VARTWGICHVVAIANWSDVEVSARWDPRDFPDLEPELAYHLVDQWTGEYLGLHRRPLDLGRLPPHGLRLLAVHPDLDRPRTVGSNGHLLGDLMDLADEQWHPATRTLTLTPSPRARQAELLVYDPHGPLRRVRFNSRDPRPLRLEFSR